MSGVAAREFAGGLQDYAKLAKALDLLVEAYRLIVASNVPEAERVAEAVNSAAARLRQIRGF